MLFRSVVVIVVVVVVVVLVEVLEVIVALLEHEKALRTQYEKTLETPIS